MSYFDNITNFLSGCRNKLLPYKYHLLTTTFFLAYINQAYAEGNETYAEKNENNLQHALTTRLVDLLSDAKDKLFRCKNDLEQFENDLEECEETLHKYTKFIEGQKNTISQQANLIYTLFKGVQRFCDIISAKDTEVQAFCEFANSDAFEKLTGLYGQVDRMHDEL